MSSTGELAAHSHVRPLAAHNTQSSALDAPIFTHEQVLDCDSEELEALENAADDECTSDTDDALGRLLDRAAQLYPVERTEAMLRDLKEDGLVGFMQKYVTPAVPTEHVQLLLVALGVLLPESVRNHASRGTAIGILKTALSRILRRREKLPHINTVDDAVDLLAKAKKVIVLSGAGISVSCGIPDFRSKDGIYAALQREGKYELDDPQDMFDKEFFMRDPSCFYSFAHSIFPSNFTPSVTHRFIKLLEDRNVLLRNYTQNIDTLEQQAGITRVLNCHGSFAYFKCTVPSCGFELPASAIKEDIMAQRTPYCPQCSRAKTPKEKKEHKKKWPKEYHSSDEEAEHPGLGWGVLKPGITFFGEKLDDQFDKSLLLDRREVDLIIVIGTSLKVAPVSELVGHMPHSTPVFLINRTPVLHVGVDLQLLGDADVVVRYLLKRLQWKLPPPAPPAKSLEGFNELKGRDKVETKSTTEKEVQEEQEDVEDIQPTRLRDSNFWLFRGAEGIERLERLLEPSSSSDVMEHNESEDPNAAKQGVPWLSGSGAGSDPTSLPSSPVQGAFDLQRPDEESLPPTTQDHVPPGAHFLASQSQFISSQVELGLPLSQATATPSSSMPLPPPKRAREDEEAKDENKRAK